MLKSLRPLVRLQDAWAGYHSQPVLRGISLDLQAGELLGLLGPNGAGKTTLINCIAGRRQLDRGRIDFSDPRPCTEFLGIVPQSIAIYPDLTVLQNLRVFGRLHGLRGSVLRQRVAEAIEWAALESKSNSLAQTLSGGMQRRLNIACSVLHKPSVLLLDEPTVGVDPQSRERIYNMVEELLALGTAVLLTTHQLNEVETRCDRIAIMDNGSVLAAGPLTDLLARTIGTSQQLSLRFTSVQHDVPAPLKLDETGLAAVAVIDGRSPQLPQLLQKLATNRIAIEHMVLREPTLEHMFLHLTGKELRE